MRTNLSHAGSNPSPRNAGSLLALLGLALAARYVIPEPRPRASNGPAKQTVERRADSPPRKNNERGRAADSPAEIPPAGWKDILLRVYANISEHRVTALAAGITYYSLFAIFPAIAAFVALYGLFADPSTIARHLDELNGLLPGGAVDVVREQLTRLTQKGAQSLGATFIIGLAISLWSANAAMKSLFDTLNIVYQEKEKRSFIKLNAISLCFTLGGVLFIAIALACTVVVPVVLNYVGLSNASDLLLRLGRWPAMFIILTLGLSLIYRYGPSREAAKWRWITYGSAIASLLWLAASGLFSWYAANFGKFDETYGSLGAVIGFMTWLWISALVILLGAEIDAEAEHQTAKDTTTGPGKQMGARGAKMADSIGPSHSTGASTGTSQTRSMRQEDLTRASA